MFPKDAKEAREYVKNFSQSEDNHLFNAVARLIADVIELQAKVQALNDHREERCDCTKEMDQGGLNLKQKKVFTWIGESVSDKMFIDEYGNLVKLDWA